MENEAQTAVQQKPTFRTEIDPLALAEFKKAEAAVLQNAEEIQRLTQKADSLEAVIPDLQKERDHAAEIKNRTLSDCAIDVASENDLSTARENYNATLRQLAETEELLSAVLTALRSAESKAAHLQSKKAEALKKIWRGLHDHYLKQIREESGYLFQRLEVCCRKIGYGFQNNPFLATPPNTLLELARQMDQEFISKQAEQ